jgi:hypothetical protein
MALPFRSVNTLSTAPTSRRPCSRNRRRSSSSSRAAATAAQQRVRQTKRRSQEEEDGATVAVAARSAGAAMLAGGRIVCETLAQYVTLTKHNTHPTVAQMRISTPVLSSVRTRYYVLVPCKRVPSHVTPTQHLSRSGEGCDFFAAQRTVVVRRPSEARLEHLLPALWHQSQYKVVSK